MLHHNENKEINFIHIRKYILKFQTVLKLRCFSVQIKSFIIDNIIFHFA